MLRSTRNNIKAGFCAPGRLPRSAQVRCGAAIDAISRIAGFVEQNPEIEELDINPLIVCAEGKAACVADALLVSGKKKNV